MKKVYKMSANVRFKGGTMIAVKGNDHHCTLSFLFYGAVLLK